MSYLPIGQSELPEDPLAPVKATLVSHGEVLKDIQTKAAEELRWRKIATAATVAGAVFALIRLSDIYFALKRSKAA